MTKARSAKPEAPTVRSRRHQAIIDREALFVAELGAQALPAIVKDRLERWREEPLITNAGEDARTWAELMTRRYGAPTVGIWHARLPWLIALAVARYGEAEDCWPAAFTPADTARAAQWYTGRWAPPGVLFYAGRAGPLEARPT